jgi:hypothetical protein
MAVKLLRDAGFTDQLKLHQIKQIVPGQATKMNKYVAALNK